MNENNLMLLEGWESYHNIKVYQKIAPALLSLTMLLAVDFHCLIKYTINLYYNYLDPDLLF